MRGLLDPHLSLLCRLLDPEPGDIEGRQKQQGQQGRDKTAADDGVGHWSPEHLQRDGIERRRSGQANFDMDDLALAPRAQRETASLEQL